MRMASFSYSELLQDLGNSSAEFGKQVVNKAANHVCALYAQYPGFFIPPAFGDFQRGFYNNLCTGRPSGLPPAPPPPQFTGGQCPDPYDISVNFTEDGRPSSKGRNVGGPIYGISVVQGDPNIPGQSLYALVIKHAYNTGGSGSTWPNSVGQTWTALSRYNTPVNYANISVVSLVRSNGMPDNCGELSTGYPPVSSLPNDGAGGINGTHTNGGTYVIPVLLKPALIGELNVDVGGINVKFDLSGATIGSGGVDLTGVMDAVNEGVAQIVDGQCACADIPNEDSYDTDTTPNNDGTSKDALQGLEWVRISISQSPSNAKSQSGNAASDVYYAGWFSFMANGASLPRQPIHFHESIFKAPEGTTGYEYCLYKGYRGSATEYKRPSTPPVV